MKKIILRSIIATALLALAGCALPDRESDIPWNTPASWETGSPFGAMINQGQ